MPRFLAIPLSHFKLTFESIKELGNALGYNKWLIFLSHFLEHVTKVSRSFIYFSNTNMLYLFSLWQSQVIMHECSLVLDHYGV
jgi:hypothetical protein